MRLSLWTLLRRTYDAWAKDNTTRLGAALAYYTAFSLAPLLVIAIGIAGLVFGEEAARGAVEGQLTALVGPEPAKAVEAMISGARQPAQGVVAVILGAIALLFGASGVFGQLQDALNAIWDVVPRPDRTWGDVVRERFFSVLLVVGTGFLLLVSLLVSAAIALALGVLRAYVPGVETVLPLVNNGVALVVTWLLFALIFKVVPDARVRWKDVWVGAFGTALLFTIGKAALGWYLGRGTFTSTYGAVGALLVVMFWVYYASQILFFGAEFTKVWAERHGARIAPASNAVALPDAPTRRAAG